MRRIATLQIGGETMHRRAFLAGLATSAACVHARAGPSTEERLALANKRLAEIEAREGGRLGVFMRDTGTGATIDHRSDGRAQRGS
jgi:beta-lactamase class A